MKYILSYGAGVNSTALLFLLLDLEYPLDDVVFADTCAELPETYKYLRKVEKFCKKEGIKFIIVKNKESIYEWYYRHKKIPIWKTRSCTDLFKIRPMRRYFKSEYKGEKIVLYMGISYEEKWRVKESNVKYVVNKFPLVEQKIDREKCKEIILSHGFEIPEKSGCFFCPFQPEWRWLHLKKKHPELFEKAIRLEENGSAFPNLTLSRKGSLRKYLNQHFIDSFAKGV